MKKTVKVQILTFILSLSFFFLNILQGSNLYFIADCSEISLGSGIFLLSFPAMFVFGVFKKRILVIRYLLPLLFASLVSIPIELYISEYQLNRTNRNLELTCDSIAKYKSDHGRLPDRLKDLVENGNSNTGFKIFNDEFKYLKKDDENFKILYKVKFGYTCEAWNCSTFFANMQYTCVLCGSVENDKFYK